jgi:beta-mannanase
MEDNIENSPENYIRAFRHVVTIFREENVENAQFIWCVGEANNPRQELFYPGDDYVDWLGIDAYNNMSQNPPRWRSFESIYQPIYNRFITFSNRPIMINEMASVEDMITPDPYAKGRWYTEALLDVIPNKMPRIRAVILFNSPGRFGPTEGFTFNTSPITTEAISELFAHPLYQGVLPDSPFLFAN